VVGSRYRRKANLKRFYIKFENKDFKEEVYYLEYEIPFPYINNNHVYCYNSFFSDFLVFDSLDLRINIETLDCNNMFDYSNIHFYAQFKHFFLISTKDKDIYIFNNYIFEKNIDELDLPIFVKKILKYEKFKEFQKAIDKDNLKSIFEDSGYFYFRFRNIIIGEELNNRLIKQYECKNDINS
jgi:hypothetical protein